MKNIIITWTFSLLQLLVSAQNVKSIDSEKTKIYIIGIIHSENEYRNSDSLLNILKKLKPDLILDEGDSTASFFSRQYLLSKPPWWYSVGRKFRLLRKMPPEVEVLFKYKEFDENVKNLPFDKMIKNKKEFSKLYFKSERKWYSLLNRAFSKGEIPDSITNVHVTYMAYNNWLHNTFKKSYKEINNPKVIDSIRQFQEIEAKYISILTASNQLFREFKTWLPLYRNFWFVRNEAMANNIINFTWVTNAKKVVVFTGLLHKPYLIDLLNSYNSEHKYELIEYFENEER